jgi:hypothetical protein
MTIERPMDRGGIVVEGINLSEAIALESSAADGIDAAKAEHRSQNPAISLGLLKEAVEKERASLDLLDQGIETLRQSLDQRRQALDRELEILDEVIADISELHS